MSTLTANPNSDHSDPRDAQRDDKKPLDDWLRSARDSHIRELQRFVRGIERDKAAVLAGLTLPHSNGIVEGQVNKLKLIKRTRYGRAGFPLLRQRALHAL